MKAEDIDYQAVLADLKVRRAAAAQYFDQAIAGIEGIIGAGALSLPAVKNGASGAGGPVEIEPESFFNLNILEAAKKYLAMVGKSQTNEQIADALRRGGLPCKADSVAAILQRALKIKDNGVCRPSRGKWGLSAWYAPAR